MTRSLLGKYALFATLGLADLALTSYLLRTSAGQVYESNPVAHWWLVRWGWAGLAGFKLTAVLLVVLAVKVVARSRPYAASHVLSFACVATALVVCYSCVLLGSARGQESRQRLPDEASIRAEARMLDVQVRQLRDFERCVDWLAEELIVGHYSLAEAVTRLATTEWARNPAHRDALRSILSNRTDAECLATLLRAHLRMLERDRIGNPEASTEQAGAE